MVGRLVAFEGLDKAGKQTQARLLQKNLLKLGYHVEVLSFPLYNGPLGEEILRVVHNKVLYPAMVVQLLFSAQRLCYQPVISGWLQDGHTVIIDRYIDSGIAYGIARGLEREWLEMVEQPMPRPDIRILLDISPEVSRQRASSEKDSFESDRRLLERVCEIYHMLVAEKQDEWEVVDGSKEMPEVEAAVLDTVRRKLLKEG